MSLLSAAGHRGRLRPRVGVAARARRAVSARSPISTRSRSRATSRVLIGPEGLGGATPNITVQASADAVVLVDSGRGDANERALAAIRRISSRPIRFIINTQAGIEHTGGNEGLARSGRPYGGRAAGAGFLLADQSAGATIIAHENVLTTLSGARGGAAVPSGCCPPRPTSRTSTSCSTAKPSSYSTRLRRTATATASCSSGARTSSAPATSSRPSPTRASTPGPEGRSTASSARSTTSSISRSPATSKRAAPTSFPGHGRVCDEADVVEYRDMLVIVRDRVRDLVTKGRTLDQIKAAKVTFDYDRRYSTPGWTGDQLVESIGTGSLPAPASNSSDGDRDGRQ